MKRSYDKLAKPDQEIIRAAAKESVPHMRKLWVAMEEEALAKVVPAAPRWWRPTRPPTPS